MADQARRPSPRPYRLIVTDDPCKTLGQGEVRYFGSMIEAANAFMKCEQPYKTILYDDGCRARELTRDESRLLAGTPQAGGRSLSVTHTTTDRHVAPRVENSNRELAAAWLPSAEPGAIEGWLPWLG
jgi:hypothetical protein